jgi:hypothetical protein
MTAKTKKLLIYAVGAVAGAAAGYLYYRLVGCPGGTCPITSNPYLSTVYGAVLGLLISFAAA